MLCADGGNTEAQRARRENGRDVVRGRGRDEGGEDVRCTKPRADYKEFKL
jgi:hypothetical protein